MAKYAEKASSEGIKVIIAAAGGAAHLPGMVAAFAPTIPVIGLPIKPSIGDGTDSLTSMTNMPNGVPVLTVGVDKVRTPVPFCGRIFIHSLFSYNHYMRSIILNKDHRPSRNLHPDPLFKSRHATQHWEQQGS